jgi:RNA-directed DNA polymerase
MLQNSMSVTPEDFTNEAIKLNRSPEFVLALKRYTTNLHSRGYPIIFSLVHLAIEMGIRSDMLIRFIHFRDNKYLRFRILKKKGGFRELMTPHRDLKYVQRWILENILNRYPLSSVCCGFRQGHSIVTNAKIHENQKYVLKVDLLKFYDTITEKRVFGIFKAMGFATNLCVDCAKLVTVKHEPDYWNLMSSSESEVLHELIIENPAVLPQGAPSSPMLSNIAATQLDHRLSGLAKKNGFAYSRYADDMTFSAAHFRQLPNISFLTSIVLSEGFYVNPKKTNYAVHGTKQYVTGLTITHNVHVSKKYRRDVYTHLRYARKYGPENHLAWRALKLDKSQNRAGFQDWLFGRIAFIYSVDKETGLKMMAEFNLINWSLDGSSELTSPKKLN